jgi:hypothetical protein
MELLWNKYPGTKPKSGDMVYVSDGSDIGLATFFDDPEYPKFIPQGIDGPEWDWFACAPITHWAPCPDLNFPK